MHRPPSSNRALWLGLPLAVLILLLLHGRPQVVSASAPAQSDAIRLPPGLSWTHRPILDGHVEQGHWSGVDVTLNNEGAGLDVEVVVQAGMGGHTFRTTVEMPAGSSKRLSLPFLPGWSGNTFVHLETDGRRSVQHRLDLEDGKGDYVILVVADDNPGLLGLEGLSVAAGAGSNATVILSTVEEIPDQALLLGTVDQVLLAGALTRADEAQLRALEQWVRLGGQLIQIGGARGVDVLGGLPEALRVAEMEGIEELPSLEAIGHWVGRVDSAGQEYLARPASVARLRPLAGAVPQGVVGLDGEAMADDGAGLPLVVSKSVGDGVVVALAVDPGMEPMRGWVGDRQLWARLHAPRPGAVWLAAADDVEVPVGIAMISSLDRWSDLPSPFLVFAVLVSYVVTVGPLNYSFLKRRKRLDLAWLTIPALTLGFTALSYGMGYVLHGGRISAGQSSLVRVPAGGGVAHVRGWFELSSPASRSYDINLGGAWAYPSANRMGYRGSRDFAILFDGEGKLRGMKMDQWTTDGFAFEAVIPWPIVEDAGAPGLTVPVTGANPLRGAGGSIASPFQSRVEAVRLLSGQQELSPTGWSGTGPIEVRGDVGGLVDSYDLAGADPQRRRIAAAFFAGPQDNDRIRSNPSIVPNVRPDPGRFPAGEYFLGAWSSEAPVKVDVDGRNASVVRATLWLAHVPVVGRQRGLPISEGKGGASGASDRDAWFGADAGVVVLPVDAGSDRDNPCLPPTFRLDDAKGEQWFELEIPWERTAADEALIEFELQGPFAPGGWPMLAEESERGWAAEQVTLDTVLWVLDVPQDQTVQQARADGMEWPLGELRSQEGHWPTEMEVFESSNPTLNLRLEMVDFDDPGASIPRRPGYPGAAAIRDTRPESWCWVLSARSRLVEEAGS